MQENKIREKDLKMRCDEYKAEYLHTKEILEHKENELRKMTGLANAYRTVFADMFSIYSDLLNGDITR